MLQIKTTKGEINSKRVQEGKIVNAPPVRPSMPGEYDVKSLKTHLSMRVLISSITMLNIVSQKSLPK